MIQIENVRDRLLEPFPLRVHELKPGSKGQGEASAQIFVDVREYQTRLDELFGWGWSVSYRMLDQFVVVCQLTILGVSREDVGDTEDEEAPPAQGQPMRRRGAHPVFGGVAQAFRRACAAFGLGRYLYSVGAVWAKFDGKKFTEDPIAVVERAFEKVGLLPVQRLEAQFARCQYSDDLVAVINNVHRAMAVNDLSTEDRKHLGAILTKRREELKPRELDDPKSEVDPKIRADKLRAMADAIDPRPRSGSLAKPPSATLQPEDYDKIEADRDAATSAQVSAPPAPGLTKKITPAFNLTPDAEAPVAGSEVFEGFKARTAKADTIKDLDGLYNAVTNDPDLGARELTQLKKIIYDRRAVVAEAVNRAKGMSGTGAKALAKATFQGPAGRPVANPMTGAVTPAQEKKAKVMTNPPGPVTGDDQKAVEEFAALISQKPIAPAPTPRASKLIDRFDAVTTFDQLRNLNEDILRADAADKFDPVDMKAIDEASATRHALLQKKSDVLNQL